MNRITKSDKFRLKNISIEKLITTDQKAKYDEIIDEQQLEIKRLKAEIRTLKALSKDVSNKSSLKIKDKNLSEAERNAEKSVFNSTLYASKNYFLFLLNSLKRSSGYSWGMKIMNYSKKFKLLTNIFSFASVALVWFQTSAIFILYSTIFIITIPFILASTAAMIVFGYIQHRKCNRKIMSEITKDGHKKKAYVIFAKESEVTPNLIAAKDYISEFAQNLTKDGDSMVFVVSPHFINKKGISTNNDFFISMREEYSNVWLIRKHYFFSLKKRILNTNDDTDRVVYIY